MQWDSGYMGWEVLHPEPPCCSQSSNPALLELWLVTAELFPLPEKALPVLIKILFVTGNINLVSILGKVKIIIAKKQTKKNPKSKLKNKTREKEKHSLNFKFSSSILPFVDRGHKAKHLGVVSQEFSSCCTLPVIPYPYLTQSPHPHRDYSISPIG